jgi:TetR/AcrR family transcriptional regulator, transcriptional repressor for nem operon
VKERSTRGHIVEAADVLFYRRGYEHTSFSDIADVVQISRGNFYFHFKTKDEILDAVIARRLEETSRLLQQWEARGDSPAERVRSFIHMLVANSADIKRYGCPVGTLCSELAKLAHAAQPEANELFTLFRAWLRRQFEALGHVAQADELAMHLLARSQGVATLANVLRDSAFIRKEVDAMCTWLSGLEDSAAPTVERNARKPARAPRAPKSGRAVRN